jgi:hypothetical protein
VCGGRGGREGWVGSRCGEGTGEGPLDGRDFGGESGAGGNEFPRGWSLDEVDERGGDGTWLVLRFFDLRDLTAATRRRPFVGTSGSLAVVSVFVGASGAFAMRECRFFNSFDLTAATRRRFAGISSSSWWTRVAGGSGETERPRFEERRRILWVESEDNGASDDCSGFAMPEWMRRRLAGASSSSQWARVARGVGETERRCLEDRNSAACGYRDEDSMQEQKRGLCLLLANKYLVSSRDSVVKAT